jgi:hypothetical protein
VTLTSVAIVNTHLVLRASYSRLGPIAAQAFDRLAKPDIASSALRNPHESELHHRLDSTLRILYRVAERFHESFAEGGWNFHVIPVVPGH